MPMTPHGDDKIVPEHLGPLGDRPLAETAKSGGPEDLFPGAAAFLKPALQKKRRAQWDAVRPLVKKLLRPDEHVLYVAHGMQVPPIFHMVAMGAMALPYHQVMLVVTESRLIEVMIDYRGKKAGTRMRSFPWSSVKELKVSFGKLKLSPAQGKKHVWNMPQKGDRKLVELLINRLKPRLLQEGASRAEAVPTWHCPNCAAPLSAHPTSCERCRTSFRSKKLATLLSLAFPGAGLLYAGHPFLAAMDFFGEVVLYVVFLMLLLQAEPGAVPIALGLGAFLFVLTKFESIHLSHILVARTKPEAPDTQSAYKKLLVAGALASVVLIAGPLPMAGKARPVLEADLDVAGDDNPWVGTRDAAEFGNYSNDPTARSQWTHPSGLHVTMFAYPQRAMDSDTAFIESYRHKMNEQGFAVTVDQDIPAPFQGFRCVSRGTNSSGVPISLVHYFVMDKDHRDIHQVAAAVVDEDTPLAEQLMGDLLSRARWIEATPPKRAAVTSQPAAATN